MIVDDLFLGRVGHDLRGELATMVAGVHYLLRYERDLSPSARQMLERVNGAGQRLKRLLDEFENAVWIGGGDRSTLVQEPCRLRMLVEAALGRLSQVIASREVTLDVQVPDDLPEFEADPEIVGMAIEYVIDFGLARSRRKSVHIRAERGDGVPVLIVTDEGGAVAPDVLAGLLDPFVEKEVVPRGEPGQRRRERLGLGLAIARGILSAHGGSMHADEAPGGDGVKLQCIMARPAVPLRKLA